jgi:hypothetical protein
MGLLDSLRALLAGSGGVGGDSRGVYFYVRCGNCGEKLRVRIDKLSEASQDIDDNDKVSGYTVEKEIIGTKCFRPMHLHVRFDQGFRISEQSLTNGEMITKQEFESES